MATVNPARESLRKEQQEQRRARRGEGRDADLTEALKGTFPASDPIALLTATEPGAKTPRVH
ncbi:hypothetical protein SAMN05216304_10831 [Bosea sp. OK403]|uniref:hypothetical protein n=1 Tax=Bosea sp. OK403 TaxID=1855286 RepID=UPI0008F38D98|nr:hypothetical protein [Bosea sp. OK403]SFJ44297.1 hypothetical protein SAMN05216304_10831 [Bosea sp. OK403]